MKSSSGVYGKIMPARWVKLLHTCVHVYRIRAFADRVVFRGANLQNGTSPVIGILTLMNLQIFARCLLESPLTMLSFQLAMLICFIWHLECTFIVHGWVDIVRCMFDAANFTDAVLSGSQFDGTTTPFFDP